MVRYPYDYAPTGIAKLNRVLGGGIVLGSSPSALLYLIVGPRGVGKTTLALQISRALWNGSLAPLFVDGEGNLFEHYKRLYGTKHVPSYCRQTDDLSTETFQSLKILRSDYDVLLVDSLNIVDDGKRGAATRAATFLKTFRNRTVIAIVHPNKQGYIPEQLEHLADVVIEMTVPFGDVGKGVTRVTVPKNRFGLSTRRGILLTMTRKGLSGSNVALAQARRGE